MKKCLTYVFDVDGTVCSSVIDGNYMSATPFVDRVTIINELYDSGNTIIFQTARGMGRHGNNAAMATRDFYQMTHDQLLSWNVKFHRLFLGKPAADIYVDDKASHDSDFFDNYRAC